MGFIYGDRFYSNPPEAKDLALRPLSKGIRRDVPAVALEAGEFFDVSNLLARTSGLQRRNGLLSYLSGASVTHPPINTMDVVWRSDGVQVACVIDSRMLYYLTSSFNLVKWSYAVGTVTCTLASGVTHVAGAGGSLWATAASDLKAGDVFYCADLSGTNKWGIIGVINSDTSMDLTTYEGTCGSGKSYEIRRSIFAQTKHFPDVLSLEGKLLICDGRREVRAYDPLVSATVYDYYSTDATFSLNPYCIAFFKDRLFVARTVETAGTLDERQRIRWTTALDLTVLPALQFVDLPYTPGFIRRLVPLESYLMCYMNDAIWVGRQTNLLDALPVAWDTKLEMGGVGLVGDRAVLPYLGGHFFVGDDNIYFLGANLNPPEAIGDPIKDLFFKDPEALWSCQISADPEHTRLMFTEPSSSGSFLKIFSFDYRAKSWTYEETAGNFIGRKQITRGFTYDTWLGGAPYSYDTGLGVFPSYDSIGTPDSARVYIGNGSTIRYYGDASVTKDVSLDVISTRIESGDFDYGAPDEERVHLRISLKIKDPIAEDLLFMVKISNDSGDIWREVTATGRPLLIKAGTKENYVNFRMRSSTFRFKLESSSVCGQYMIQEIVLRAVGTGVETHLASNR